MQSHPNLGYGCTMVDFQQMAAEVKQFALNHGTLASGGTGTLPFSDSPQDLAEFAAEGMLDGDDLCEGIPYEEFVESLTEALQSWSC